MSVSGHKRHGKFITSAGERNRKRKKKKAMEKARRIQEKIQKVPSSDDKQTRQSKD